MLLYRTRTYGPCSDLGERDGRPHVGCPVRLERVSLAASRDLFVARVKRWFQPSQTPYASLTEPQALLLAATAAKVAERLLGRDEIALNEGAPLNPPAESGLFRNGVHVPDGMTDQVDQEFLLEWPLLSHGHVQVTDLIYNDYITSASASHEMLSIVGEPYSGKKSILTHLIKRYKKTYNRLRVFALSCAGLTYTEVGTQLANFLSTMASGPDELDVIGHESFEMIRDRALQFPAVYVFADLEVLPGNPAYQLITQQNDVSELIRLLLRSNEHTRVIISCEEPRQDQLIPPGGYMMKVEPGNRRLVWVAPPTMQMLLEDLTGNINRDSQLHSSSDFATIQ